jgi:hypothetical protein
MKTKLLSLLLLALACFVAPAASAADEPVKPYPLKVCIVTDNDLGSMGDEKVIIYEAQEIKFCCAPCEKKFRKNPDRYLKKLTPPT